MQRASVEVHVEGTAERRLARGDRGVAVVPIRRSDPESALPEAVAADELAGADERNVVRRELGQRHAPPGEPRAALPEAEVEVVEPELAALRGEVAGSGGDDVQEEPRRRVLLAAPAAGVGQRTPFEMHVEGTAERGIASGARVVQAGQFGDAIEERPPVLRRERAADVQRQNDIIVCGDGIPFLPGSEPVVLQKRSRQIVP